MATRFVDLSLYFVDFSNRNNLTNDEKESLKNIQDTLLPLDRVPLLLEFLVNAKITTDDYEKMTGLPYQFDPYGLSGTN